MTPDPTKQSLDSFRADRPLQEQPELANAWQQAQADPALQAWLDNEQAFDRAFRSAISDLAPPADLLEKLYTIAPPAAPVDPLPAPETTDPAWWRSPTMISLAASVALLLAVTIFALNPQRLQANPAELPLFYEEICKPPCVRNYNLRTDNLLVIQSYLQDNEVPVPGLFPLGTHSLQPVGCRVIEWKGKTVTQICLQDEQGRHAHLYTSYQAEFPNDELPQGVQFFQDQDSAYAVWSHANEISVFIVRGTIDDLKRFL